MNNLLYKEFKLSIHGFFFLLPVLTGACCITRTLALASWIFNLSLNSLLVIAISYIRIELLICSRQVLQEIEMMP